MEPYQLLAHRLAEWAGYPAENVVVCASGTAALHLALEAFRLPPGAEVICPDLTMVACARAISLAGLTPVFVDCGDDLLMDQGRLSSVPGQPKALMLVHVYGRQSAPSRGTLDYARRMRAMIIEDLAEAHGVRPHSDTDAACWSFFRNKIVAGEEGGAVAFKDPVHAALARQLRCLGFTDAHDFRHVPRGHNYRMSNAHARLILDSLSQFKSNVLERRRIEAWCDAACPPGWRMPPRDAPWVYDLRVPGMTGETQDAVVRRLRGEGIEARHCFRPMSEQAEYRDCRRVGGENAARLAREVIYLPLTPGAVTQSDVARALHLIHAETAGRASI